MGVFTKIAVFGLGVYTGIYYAQNGENVPKVDDPATLLKKIQAYIEQNSKPK